MGMADQRKADVVAAGPFAVLGDGQDYAGRKHLAGKNFQDLRFGEMGVVEHDGKDLLVAFGEESAGDPAGAAALMIRSSTTTRGRTLPRPRRFSRLTGFAGSVALSMPLGLTSGGPFKPFSRAISPAPRQANNAPLPGVLPLLPRYRLRH